jgi:hypothetical protein
MKYALFFALFAIATCDLYLHHPRGSNDRLNEANTNRNNANRLFDSQNNAKGGYCWGPEMTFYEKSLLAVEWTNQHGCGANPKLVCNLIVQYICTDADANPYVRVRDGATTDTITDDANGPVAQDTNGDLLYGMHEPYHFYQNCKARERNMGLFIGDREQQGGLNAGRASAIYTRQNNNGNRHGYECPEERDYYPYWHPSPWKDVVILSHNPDWCDFYTSESQNVKSKNFCTDPANPNIHARPNNEADCTSSGYTWEEQPAWGIAAPECIQAPWARENHLGNGQQNPGFANNYNWTIPSGENCTDSDAGCSCALRIRYNVSTTEYGFDDMSNPASGFIDSQFNADASPVQQDSIINEDTLLELALAQDTTQFGRTFEDRSHVFRISKRPDGVPALARIFNLNVRGKRGNIVQAYPSTEYDFIPQHLYARVGDYVHFQWTGCDTNPAGNAGEGTDGTDRTNCVQIPDPWTSYPITDQWILDNPKKVLFESPELRLRMAHLDQTNCLPRSQIGGNQDNDVRNCGKLNGADRYFDGGVIRMNRTGSFNFMSTRNHNFTNRDQKGTISILPLLPNWALGIVIGGAALFAGAAGVAVMMFYAKNNPHSQVANIFSKM